MLEPSFTMSKLMKPLEKKLPVQPLHTEDENLEAPK